MKDVIQTINDLKQKRMKVVSDQKALLAKAQTDSRSVSDWTPDERSAYDKAEEDFGKYDAEIRTLEAMREKEERIALEQHQERTYTASGDPAATGSFATTTTEPKPEEQYRKVFNKYLRRGANELEPDERALLRKNYVVDKDGEQRAQTVTTTGGGYVIPQGFSNQVEQVMKYFGPMIDPGVAGELNTASGNPFMYPTLDGTSTSGRLLAINTAVTTTDLTFGQVQFDAYKYSSDQILVPVELLEDEMVNLESVIANQLGERLGRIMNAHLTTGTGSGQPNGVVTASANGKTAAAQTAFTRDELIDLLHSVDIAYRKGPKVAWMFNDLVLASIKKMTIGSGDDRPLWQPSIIASEPDRLEGYPFHVNNDMASSVAAAAKVILFGDFSKYLVRRVAGLRMLRLTERYADTDQVGYVGFMRLDGDLIATGSIKRLTMAA